MADMLKLYTFNISHFSEKARWTLDYEGIPYEERVLLPGPHQLVTRRIAPRTHVPVLEHDGQYVQGSSAIIDYVADRLGGAKLTAINPAERAKALELENTLDHAFGRGVQQVLYSALVNDRRTVIGLWSARGPFSAGGFHAVAFPVVASAVSRMYTTVDVDGVARAKQRFVTTFDELDAVLAKQPYLGGDAPDRTDITLAALLAPVCRVPEHRVKWPAMPRSSRTLKRASATDRRGITSCGCIVTTACRIARTRAGRNRTWRFKRPSASGREDRVRPGSSQGRRARNCRHSLSATSSSGVACMHQIEDVERAHQCTMDQKAQFLDIGRGSGVIGAMAIQPPTAAARSTASGRTSSWRMMPR